MKLNQTNHMRTLAPHEIAAVGGGPEATVGTGMNPPAATGQAALSMHVLSTTEIGAVAGGPEGEVGTTVSPPRKEG